MKFFDYPAIRSLAVATLFWVGFVGAEAVAGAWDFEPRGDLGGWAHFDHVDRLDIYLDSEQSYALFTPRPETSDQFLSLSVIDRQAFQIKRRQILMAVAHFFEHRPELTGKMSFLTRFLGSSHNRSSELKGTRTKNHLFIEALLQKIDGLFLQENLLSIARSKDMELYTGMGLEAAAGTPEMRLGEHRIAGFALGAGLAVGCEFAVDLSFGQGRSQDRNHNQVDSYRETHTPSSSSSPNHNSGRLCLKSIYLDFELVRKAFLPTFLASLNGRMVAAASPQLGSRQGRFYEKIQTYYMPGGPLLLRNDRILGGGLALGLSVPPLVATAASFEVVTYRLKLPFSWGHKFGSHKSSSDCEAILSSPAVHPRSESESRH